MYNLDTSKEKSNFDTNDKNSLIRHSIRFTNNKNFLHRIETNEVQINMRDGNEK